MFIVKHVHQFKGLSQKCSVPWARKTEFKCRTLKVNVDSTLLYSAGFIWQGVHKFSKNLEATSKL